MQHVCKQYYESGTGIYTALRAIFFLSLNITDIYALVYEVAALQQQKLAYACYGYYLTK